MKFKKILDLNKDLIKLKDDKVKFSYHLACKILDLLDVTNIIVNQENMFLNSKIEEIGEFDGYTYVTSDEAFNNLINEINNKDLEFNENLLLDDKDLTNDTFDLETIKYISNSLKINNK